MPIFDPSRDFRDDGGTPAFRRRKATILASQPPRSPFKHFKHWYRRASPGEVLLACIVAGLAIWALPIVLFLALTLGAEAISALSG